MKNVMLVIFALSSLLFADSKTDKLLNEVDKVYSQLENVCAEFTQTFYWKLTEEQQMVSGTICAKGGDRFRIDTPEQLIVTNGKTLWTVNKRNGQVIIDHAENAASDNPFIKEFISKYLRDYAAAPFDQESTDDLSCVVLTARTDDQFVRTMYLWIDAKSKLIKKIKQIDLNENITTFELTNIDLNAQLVTRDFEYKPSGDADIVDMR